MSNNFTGLPENSLLIGDGKYPYHLSVGIVAVKDGKVAVLKRNMEGKGEIYLLPKETVQADETFRQVALRGLKEELGGKGKLISFVGSRPYQFMRGDVEIKKTVIYFLLEVSEIGERMPEENEKDDEVLLVDKKEAIELLSNKDNPEAFGWEGEFLSQILNS